MSDLLTTEHPGPEVRVRTAAPASVHVSVFDLFSVGIGPSSSHTVGPMRAAARFREALGDRLIDVTRWTCALHGSLAATGIGHGTPDAVLAGLGGADPEICDPDAVRGTWAAMTAPGQDRAHPVPVPGGVVPFHRADMTFEPFARHHGHPNAMTLGAEGTDGVLLTQTWLSVGGGFVVLAGGLEARVDSADRAPTGTVATSSPYRSGQELVASASGRSIAAVARDHERLTRSDDAIDAGLDRIAGTMHACIDKGLGQRGTLPGRLGVRRRAADAAAHLVACGTEASSTEWIAVYALAVNEENAAGGRIVTAPTNGAAGVLPAVLRHLTTSLGLEGPAVRDFLLTATAIGSLIKAGASISGAEAGCQGEVGSACAMAAAGATAVLGGTPDQVENAAEIALEHHLGLTCDPVGGLVQIPCIERNAVAATTALTAARIALMGDGRHVVSLDTVIETMRQTGDDMSARYKETSEGGLAVNVVEC
ncbi:L-serine ammonia-lyase [Curtobacterium sp. MCPF17_002]|uniref:L-serine ammonia-lyase n=1 Tax=Curtobacterium sp. MCPF17_002 TaxID=2175645 RepID=UPI000DA8AFB8|nr:L-serine ammonia-lyase [Curtobacterium sp. MCPF17_002]WIB78626.1 L-serine ammonia-lyase [Curtobacterium sp. MCPF17_002]